MALDLSNLENAQWQLEQVFARSQDERFMTSQDEITRNAIRAGVIQHFEIVYELCWKFMQRWIRENRTLEEADHARTRKDLFRLAAQSGLIEDPLRWFKYAEARNLSVHTYNQNEAEAIYNLMQAFTRDARYLLESLRIKND
ncbi:MAG: HI0074 family nucleotidyltransferase substrate-binding subunit [Bacillota bacterium]|nr:HI0074 family nucleotidyltransferase substrate-binding subunit [Bacillota bacterium]